MYALILVFFNAAYGEAPRLGNALIYPSESECKTSGVEVSNYLQGVESTKPSPDKVRWYCVPAKPQVAPTT
jgi:hypothetical protein